MAEFPQFAYTGSTPEKGYVGYINIQETDKGVRFIVRSEGENPTTGVYEIDLGSAIELLDNALTALCDRE